MRLTAGAADLALEASIIGAHTSVGFNTRARLEHWPPAAAADLSNRRFVVTGATSGIGRSIARSLAQAGAAIRSASRSPQRAEVATRELKACTGNDDITIETVDLSRPGHAFEYGTRLAEERIDGIIHAAGAYFSSHTHTQDGIEANAAIYLIGPFALTAALAPALTTAPASSVITISSSGAYATALDVQRLESDPDRYRPLSAYARAKRAQIVLTHAWQERFGDAVTCSAVTPGWCDTDLVRQGLPRFRAFFRPILRTADQGADTAVWLASNTDHEPDRLWRDRRMRLEHRLPWTPFGDSAEMLWQWCRERSGHHLPERAENEDTAEEIAAQAAVVPR